MKPTDWALTSALPPAKKLLLVALIWIADESGVTVKSQATIGKRLGKDDRWVREHLPELAAKGFVSRIKRTRKNKSHTTDLIVVNFPRTEPLDLALYEGSIAGIEAGDTDPRATGENPPGGTGEESPEGAAKTRRATRRNQPEKQPPPEGTREQVKMSFRGKHVPAAVVADATWLLATFNEETGRNITATARTLQRIVGALLDAPEVPVERWQQAVKLTVADPPSWVDGQLQLGHIFGPNAAQHALAKTEKPASARTSIDRFMAAQDKAQRRAA